MNYIIKKVSYDITNTILITKNIIDKELIVFDQYINQNNITLEDTTVSITDLQDPPINIPQYTRFKIIAYIGRGTTGQVYLLESIDDNKTKYVIKISNRNYCNSLIDEMKLIKYYFTKYNISHVSYPINCGHFKKQKAYGIIYPYFGFYSLEKIKTISYNIDINDKIKMIIQIINQLKSLTNVIHCDIKPSNIVIDTETNNATIIDFGLIQPYTSNYLISTNYITSPESLLTLDKYYDCVIHRDDKDLSKHDYFGLFSIIIHLFIKTSYWTILQLYLLDKNYTSNEIIKCNAYYIYVYNWYKFNYNTAGQIKNKSLYNIINKIEFIYPSIIDRDFTSFDDFFNKYIKPSMYESITDENIIIHFKSFIELLIKFDPVDRPSLDDLLTHPFLVITDNKNL
jgi:serine/threonine protein kinase